MINVYFGKGKIHDLNEMYEKEFKGRSITLFARLDLEECDMNELEKNKEKYSILPRYIDEIKNIGEEDEEIKYVCRITPLLNCFSPDFVSVPSELNSDFKHLGNNCNDNNLSEKYEKYYDNLFLLLTEDQKVILFTRLHEDNLSLPCQLKISVFQKV
jgi:hypothetical protein